MDENSSNDDAPKTRAEQGLDLVRELLGPEVAAKLGGHIASGGFGSAMLRRGLESTYGDVWSRPGLSRAERSLVTLGVLIASRAEGELRQHVRVALRHGLTAEQIDEAILQASPYVGIVASLSAWEAATSVVGARSPRPAGD